MEFLQCDEHKNIELILTEKQKRSSVSGCASVAISGMLRCFNGETVTSVVVGVRASCANVYLRNVKTS